MKNVPNALCMACVVGPDVVACQLVDRSEPSHRTGRPAKPFAKLMAIRADKHKGRFIIYDPYDALGILLQHKSRSLEHPARERPTDRETKMEFRDDAVNEMPHPVLRPPVTYPASAMEVSLNAKDPHHHGPNEIGRSWQAWQYLWALVTCPSCVQALKADGYAVRHGTGIITAARSASSAA